MKHVLVIAFLTAFGCSDQQPGPDTNQEGADQLVDTVEDLTPQLATLVDPTVIFHPPPELAAVRPTASLQFRFASCGERDWTVKRKVTELADGTVVMLQVEDGDVDCAGPTKERTYAIQVTSDAILENRFVLLNPSQLSMIPETDAE